MIWDDDVGDYMRGLLNRQVPFIEIPEARHHVMLDQPLAFVAALRTLLQEWQHSTADRVVATASADFSARPAIPPENMHDFPGHAAF